MRVVAEHSRYGMYIPPTTNALETSLVRDARRSSAVLGHAHQKLSFVRPDLLHVGELGVPHADLLVGVKVRRVVVPFPVGAEWPDPEPAAGLVALNGATIIHAAVRIDRRQVVSPVVREVNVVPVGPVAGSGRHGL